MAEENREMLLMRAPAHGRAWSGTKVKVEGTTMSYTVAAIMSRKY